MRCIKFKPRRRRGENIQHKCVGRRYYVQMVNARMMVALVYAEEESMNLSSRHEQTTTATSANQQTNDLTNVSETRRIKGIYDCKPYRGTNIITSMVRA